MSGYSSGIRQKSDPSLYYSFSFNYFVIHHSAGCAGAAHKVASYIILKFPQSPVKKSAPTSANYHLLCLCTTPWQHQVDRIISPTLCVCSILHLPTAHIKSINQQLHPSGMRILFKCLSGAIC